MAAGQLSRLPSEVILVAVNRGGNTTETGGTTKHLDVEILIVGAGFSGLGMGIELLRRNRRSFLLLERSHELGGSWRDNTYPGISVDIPSSSYCYSFETNFPWSRAYAPGHEILAYARRCAEKYGLAPYIRYNSEVVASTFDPKGNLWTTQLADGTLLRSRYLVSATGVFQAPYVPRIRGANEFAGASFHTARWDHRRLLDGRVAVIGTGASAVQVVPEIASQAKHLTVFQRTPIWISKKRDVPLPTDGFSFRRFGPVRYLRRAASEFSFQLASSFTSHHVRLTFVATLLEWMIRRQMRRTINDPSIAEKLIPRYRLGCKRPTFSNTYLESFNLDHVRLVTDPIERICREGILTSDGVLHPVDTIVFATGFALGEKHASPSFPVYGLSGKELGEFWHAERRQAYAGVSIPDFPNFFLTAGPYSGGLNWFSMLEAHILHIMHCLEAADAKGATRVHVGRDAHDAYMRDMWSASSRSVFTHSSCHTANSYYLDRRGDASRPLPHTPWWRWLRVRIKKANGYEFT